MKKKIFSTMCVVTAFALLLSGCGGKKNSAKQEFSVDKVEFPVTEDITLKIWTANVNNAVANYSEMGCYKEMTKNTGIKTEFIHPTAGQVAEQFNIMIASKEYPDIIERFGASYQGGYAKGFKDGVIYDLNELIDKYAPNLKGIYDTHPELRMASSSDDGKIYEIPFIRGGGNVKTNRGLVIRKDYLDKFGIAVPETMDDWYNMLTEFKNNGIEYPFASTSSMFQKECFIGAFGINFGYFVEDGKVKYGQYDERYKDYIKTMAKWYSEGLLDSEITINNDSKALDSKVINSGAGAFVASLGGGIGGYLTEFEKTNDGKDLVAAPYPVMNKGDVAYIIQRDNTVISGSGSSITTGSQYPEYAMAFLDYAYSQEGHMLMNFGVEGESYEMVDGYPKFTEYVTKNPDGKSMAKAGSEFARSFTWGTFMQDTRYGEQFYSRPQQQEALKVWSKTVDEASKKAPVIQGKLSPEETAEIATMENEIKTYTDEMYSKWITGKSDVEADFDKYISQLKSLGIERCIEVYQAAHDRYIERYPELSKSIELELSSEFFK
ncbi:MAG: extracellular solute-binding protein [Clostridia bacterium]|nr:extracellular solute-binding protein [Clostridia bacterium]